LREKTKQQKNKNLLQKQSSVPLCFRGPRRHLAVEPLLVVSMPSVAWRNHLSCRLAACAAVGWQDAWRPSSRSYIDGARDVFIRGDAILLFPTQSAYPLADRLKLQATASQIVPSVA
jgi:hypothetical protein